MIFYAFYLDLRRLEKRRLQLKNQMPRAESVDDNLLRVFSSIPNIYEFLRDSDYSLQSRALRHQSLTRLDDYSLESYKSSDDLSFMIDYNMTPAEKTMKILNLTEEDLEDARKHRSTEDLPNKDDASSIQREVEDNAHALSGSDSGSDSDTTSDDSSDYTLCSCTTSTNVSSVFKRPESSRSSFDDDARSKENFFGPASNPRTGVKAKRINYSNHRLKTALDASKVNLLLRSHDSGLQLRFNANFKLFDMKFHSTSHMKKWLNFHNELDSNLDGNYLKTRSLFEEAKSSANSKDQETQTKKFRRPKSAKWRRLGVELTKKSLHKANKDEILGIPKQTFVSYQVMKNSNFSFHMPTKKSSLFYPIKYRRSNISILKSMKPTDWSKYLEDKRAQELRNLRAYNKLTLEQDRQEISQSKKKRPKSHKKPAEKRTIQIRNSEPAKSTQGQVESPAKSQRRSSLRERIDLIDWSTNSSYSLDYRGPKTSAAVRRSQEDPDRRIIVDDETLSQLQNAFSFSDETERGFQLGPELNEPYPVFQVVALTMAEIFKATGWRNLTCSAESDTPVTTAEDIIYCGSEVEVEDAIEHRMVISVNLLQQLQDLLESSRETLLALENSRMEAITESRLRLIELTDEFFTRCTSDYIDAFRELTTFSERISRQLRILMGGGENNDRDGVRMIYENKSNFNPSKTLVNSLEALPSTSRDFREEEESEDDLVELFNGFFNTLSARLGNRDKLKELARTESFLNFIFLFGKEDLEFLCKKIFQQNAAAAATPKPCEKKVREVLITEIELHSSEFHHDDDHPQGEKKSVVTSTNHVVDVCLPSTSKLRSIDLLD